jgi:cytochrome c-type biogenesis protein CcmH/NrfG
VVLGVWRGPCPPDAQKCVELKPDWAKGYSRLGVALFKKGDLAGAQKAYAGGIACDPNNAQCNDGLAEVRAARANQAGAYTRPRFSST